MADLKAAPHWLIRFNAILLWLNPALGLVAVLLALLVIAAAGQHPSTSAANTPPRIVRLAAAPSPEPCRPTALPPEIRELSLYD